MVTLGSAGVAAGALSAPAARAEARRLLIKAALADLPTAPERKKVPLFADYAEEFWLDYSPHWNPSTRRSSRYRIDKQLVPRFGDLPIDMIARADINRWRDSMSDKGGSFNRSIPIMSVMMQYAEKLGYRIKGSNPCRGVSRFKRELPERYLSADEYRRLGRVLADHDGANPFVVPALLMLIYTGARVSEIATLRWRYVQIPRLALPDSKTGPKTIYLNPQAIAVLDGLERRGDNDLVFPQCIVRKQSISASIGPRSGARRHCPMCGFTIFATALHRPPSQTGSRSRRLASSSAMRFLKRPRATRILQTR